MLTVIVEARADADRLAGLLAQLTAGAVEGLVRQVLVVGPRDGLIAELCEATGADVAPGWPDAMQAARSDLLLAAPAALRLREGWVEAVTRYVADGGRAAIVRGQGRPVGLLVERARAVGQRDLGGLRRQLGLLKRRIG
jgi:hypothetical protein